MENIRDRQHLAGSLWDFARWNEIFSLLRPGIRPSDADGLLHYQARDGTDHFLLLEGASPEKGINRGQLYLHRALVRQPNWTVIRWWGNAETWEVESYEVMGALGDTPHSPCTAEHLDFVIESWVAMVRS